VAGVLISPSGNYNHTTSAAFVGTLGHSLSSRLTACAEAAWYPVPAATNAAYAGITGAYLVSRRLQLDAQLHRGLTEAASDWLIGVGISAHF
jgi:hypothetical protein